MMISKIWRSARIMSLALQTLSTHPRPHPVMSFAESPYGVMVGLEWRMDGHTHISRVNIPHWATPEDVQIMLADIDMNLTTSLFHVHNQ